MSYEFNPENPVFEFPNPYKVENLSLFVSGGFMILTGLAIVVGIRERIGHGIEGRTLGVLGISILLLLFGIGLVGRAFTQLRYFFGRNRPASLAQLVAPDKDGDSKAAAELKETLRQNALTYSEPTGPLNGLLYSWLPQLIFAPAVIQRTAQTQFHNFLALTATLISFALCWLISGQGAASGWIGLIYAAFSLPQIVRPMTMPSGSASGPMTASTTVGSKGLIVLILLAILGPVILGTAGSHLPDLGKLSINGALFVALSSALVGCGVFGLALKNQLQPAPQAIGAARVTETVTMNAHPNKLVEELDRILMERWYSRIPNRRYTRRSPLVDGPQGQFSAEMFEETQPRPQQNRTASGVGHALSVPQFQWLTALTGLATLYLIIGTMTAALVTNQILRAAPISTSVGFAISLLMVGSFCMRAAHVLWGRFDFVSELIWVDISGSYEAARVNIGNQISGNVQTTKNVINIESMTMRVWVSEIDTVIFGKDAWRQLIGMRGLQKTADELAAALKGFGEARPMVVSPTSANDLERARQVGAMNQLVKGDDGGASGSSVQQAAAVLSAASNQAAIGDHSAAASFAKPAFCKTCGAKIDVNDKFCGECGTRAAS